jgi:hypothetical protein
MDDARNVELSTAEIKRLIDALHTSFEAHQHDGKEKSEADKVLLMKLVEALR